MTKMRKGFAFAILVVFLLSFFNQTSAMATEKPISKEYVGIQTNASSTRQYKVYRYTYTEHWTKYKTLSGQPAKGTYLKKGDGLYYLENEKGITASVSFGAGLSVSVPLGQFSKKAVGVFKRADKKGYYVLQSKKQVTPTAKYGLKVRKRDSAVFAWGPWKDCNKNLSTSYTTVKVKPRLKLIK